jgi:hypothetical protein
MCIQGLGHFSPLPPPPPLPPIPPPPSPQSGPYVMLEIEEAVPVLGQCKFGCFVN